MVPIVNIIIIKVIKKLKNILYRIKIISLTIIINIAKNVNIIITSIKIIMKVITKFKMIHILTTKLKKIKKINMNTSMGNLVKIITIKIINIKDTIIMIIIITISMSMNISMIMDIAIKVSV